MAYGDQYSALTGGRRLRPGYVDQVNVQTKYLPALARARRDEQYANQRLGLSQRSLAQNNIFNNKRLNLIEDANDLTKKRNKTAERLGYTNLGLSAGLGAVKAYPAIKDVGKDVIDFFNPGSITQVASPIETITSGSTAPTKLFGGGTGAGLISDAVGDLIDFDFDDLGGLFS
jgi:hypothetical protein